MEAKTITTDRCIRICDEKAVLEGMLSLPYDTDDLANVLEICGCAEIFSVSSSTGYFRLNGKARYTVLYCTKDGTYDSFDSECDFEHTVSHEEAQPELRVTANAQVTETNWQIDDAKISLRSTLTLAITAILPTANEILSVERTDAFECDSISAPLVHCSAKSIKAYADRALRIPQTMPEVEKILLVRANADFTSVTREPERIIIEGALCVCILYESKDKNAPLQAFHERVPFGEIVNEPSCRESSQLCAELSVERITAEQTDADSLRLAGVVAVNTVCINEHSETVIRDLYALEQDSQAEFSTLALCYPTLCDHLHKSLRINTEIPESAPEAARILSASSQPEIIGIVSENGNLSVDGILHIMLICSTAEAGVKSIRFKEPFELSIGHQPNAKHIRAFSESTVAQGSGRSVSLKINLSLSLFGEEAAQISAVRSVALTDRAEPFPCGITVYYAEPNESLWEICKKHGVSQQSAIPLDNKDSSGIGRVMLMR